MKAIQTQAIITSFRSRADGSIGFSGVTPELKPTEKTVFFELQNINLHLLITPLDEPELEVEQVKGDLNTKTASQRLRAVLYVHFKQLQEVQDPDIPGTFEDFYRQQMEKIIEGYKGKNLEQK